MLNGIWLVPARKDLRTPRLRSTDTGRLASGSWCFDGVNQKPPSIHFLALLFRLPPFHFRDTVTSLPDLINFSRRSVLSYPKLRPFNGGLVHFIFCNTQPCYFCAMNLFNADRDSIDLEHAIRRQDLSQLVRAMLVLAF